MAFSNATSARSIFSEVTMRLQVARQRTLLSTLNASWEWLGGRRRGRGRGRISRVGVQADSRPFLFFSSGQFSLKKTST